MSVRHEKIVDVAVRNVSNAGEIESLRNALLDAYIYIHEKAADDSVSLAAKEAHAQDACIVCSCAARTGFDIGSAIDAAMQRGKAEGER